MEMRILLQSRTLTSADGNADSPAEPNTEVRRWKCGYSSRAEHRLAPMEMRICLQSRTPTCGRWKCGYSSRAEHRLAPMEMRILLQSRTLTSADGNADSPPEPNTDLRRWKCGYSSRAEH